MHYAGITRAYAQEYTKSCPTCQLKAPQTTRPPLKPIVETDFLARLQVDLIDQQNSPDGEYKYIAHVMDHFTKFHILFPLKEKTAAAVCI